MKTDKLKNILTKEFLEQEYIILKQSMEQIALKVGTFSSIVFKYLKKYNIKSRKFEGKTTKKYYCKICKAEITYHTALYGSGLCGSCSGKNKVFTTEHKQNIKINHADVSGKNNHFFKDGRTLKNNKCVICEKNVKDYRWRTCSIKCRKIDVKNRKVYNLENNPNWQNGIGKLPYSFDFTEKLKEQIRKRDNFECQNCHMTEEEHLIVYGRALAIHHIDYNKKNSNENNLISLCIACNFRANYNRDYWYAYFMYIMEEIYDFNYTK